MSVIGEKIVATKKNYEMTRFKANLKPEYSKHDHPLSKMRSRENLQINAGMIAYIRYFPSCSVCQ